MKKLHPLEKKILDYADADENWHVCREKAEIDIAKNILGSRKNDTYKYEDGETVPLHSLVRFPPRSGLLREEFLNHYNAFKPKIAEWMKKNPRPTLIPELKLNLLNNGSAQSIRQSVKSGYFSSFKLVVCERKHNREYHLVRPYEMGDFGKAALKNFEYLESLQVFSSPPENPEEFRNVSDELLNQLDPVYSKILKDEIGERALAYRNAKINYENELREFEWAKLVRQGDTLAAVKIMRSRCNYQYERYEVIELDAE